MPFIFGGGFGMPGYKKGTRPIVGINDLTTYGIQIYMNIIGRHKDGNLATLIFEKFRLFNFFYSYNGPICRAKNCIRT
jgi:hypothetical protein